MRRLGTALLVASLSMAFASTALGEPSNSPVELVWDAPSPCPNAEAVLAQIKGSLSSASAVREHAVVEVHVSRGEQGRWNATLRIATRAGTSERALEAESCPAIASAISLVALVAVEGTAAPPPPASPAATPASPPTPSTQTPAKKGASQEVSRSQLVLSGDVVADNGGTMPGLRFGGEVGGGLGLRLSSYRLRALAGASYFPSATTGVPDRPSETGTFELWTAVVRGCGTRLLGPIELGPCLGGELDAMNASSVGTKTSFPGTHAWGALVGSGFASLYLGGAIAIFVRVDGVLPVAPPTFVIYAPDATGGRIVVHQPSSFSGRGALGVEVHIF